MEFNAYVVDWSIDGFEEFKRELKEAGFSFAKKEGTENLRVAVPFERMRAFAALGQLYLNAPQNYVDIQYPGERKTVIIFREKVCVIANQTENEQVRAWALAQGLPPEQADWATSF